MIQSLSICVPTFNRAKYLAKLYQSILDISSHDKFIKLELIIVNDGSTDQTENLINAWKKNTPIKIIYIKHPKNLGRSYALYNAIKAAKMEYTFIMDDEDYLKFDFFKILSSINFNQIDSNLLAGFVFLRENIDGKINGNLFVKDYFRSDLISIRNYYNKRGEVLEITKTSILKDNLYTPFINEKRISTECIWFMISEKYDYYFFNKSLSVRYHLPGGISDNIVKHKMKSPNSSFYYEILRFNSSKVLLISKIKACIQSSRYICHGANLKVFNISISNYIFIYLFFIIGFIFYIKDIITINYKNKQNY